MHQRTLVLIKPDAMQRNLAGEIISRLERVGLTITDCRMVTPDRDFAEKHYPVTDDWFVSVGNRTIADCEKYSVDVKEAMGTTDPKEIGQLIHKWNVDFFTGQKIMAIVFEGVHAVEVARKLAGATLPLLAAPGTIRGDYSSSSALSENSKKRTIQNLVHTSGDPEEAEREIELWFGD